jgi:hypothetical protein
MVLLVLVLVLVLVLQVPRGSQGGSAMADGQHCV